MLASTNVPYEPLSRMEPDPSGLPLYVTVPVTLACPPPKRPTVTDRIIQYLGLPRSPTASSRRATRSPPAETLGVAPLGGMVRSPVLLPSGRFRCSWPDLAGKQLGPLHPTAV